MTDEIKKLNERLNEEIAERKKMEEALLERESQDRALFEGSPDAILLADPETGIILDANPAACRLLARPYAGIIGLHQSKIHPSQGESYSSGIFKEPITESMEQNGLHPSETVILRPDGSEVPVEVLAQLVTIKRRKFLQGVFRDIAQRRQMEEVLRTSEEKFRKVFLTSPDSININRLQDGMYVSINDGFTLITGYTADDVVGRTSLELDIWADPADRQKLVDGLRERGEVKNLEARFRTKDARIIDGLMSASIIEIDHVLYLVNVTRDITERKRFELTLKQSESKYRRLYNETPVLLHSIDRAARLVDVNDYWLKTMGYERNEVIGRKLTDFYTEASRKYAQEVIQPAFFRDGIVKDISYQFVKKNGEVVDVLLSATAERDAAGNVVRSQAVIEDITERKRAEAARRESEIKFRAVFENSRDALDISKNGVHYFANPAYLKLFGHESNEKIIGNSILDDIAPSHHQQISQYIRRRIAGDPVPALYVTRGRKTDGTEFYMEINAAAFELQGEIYSVASIRDISERKLAEEEHERLTVAIEQAGETVVVTDAEGTIQYVNPMFETMTGYTRAEAVGQNPHFLKSGKHDPAFYLELWDTITSGRVWHGRFINRKKDGSLFIEDATISPVRDNESRIVNYVAVKRDITEQLRAVEEKARLEDQLRQSQKMESIGTLAGGIAHDFNNILTAIIGYGSIALKKIAKDDPQRLNIEHILDAGNRAAHLTKDLLVFSRKQSSERKPIDLNDAIRKVEAFLKRIIGEDIECKTTQYPGALPFLGDSHQLEQVLMNLATNARDAMPKGGVFSVSTDRVMFDNEFVSVQGYIKPGNYAMITVSDTGKGMDEVTRAHIFEPFYTTKEVGKGTGLGLSVVYGIIKQHEGFIDVNSKPAYGTSVKIYLPIIMAHLDETTATVEEHPAGGMETILLAEDDETVRNLTKTVLVNFGYRVITANDGQDAVNQFKMSKDRIQLLLFDLIMPKKTGKEAYDEIKTMTPAVKVLFVSGYAPDMIRQRMLIEDMIQVVNKPISPMELLKKVRETLDR